MNFIEYFKNFIEILSLFKGTGIILIFLLILIISLAVSLGVQTLKQPKSGVDPPVLEPTEKDSNHWSRQLNMSFKTTFLELKVDTKKESHPIHKGCSSRKKTR